MQVSFALFIIPEVSLVPVTLHPYFPCCSFLKLSSPRWPACWQRCFHPIWSGRFSAPWQSLIFKEGPVVVKASFLSTPPALVGSLHRRVNLFSIIPGAAQIASLLLQPLSQHTPPAGRPPQPPPLPQPQRNLQGSAEGPHCARGAAGADTLPCRAALLNGSH